MSRVSFKKLAFGISILLIIYVIFYAVQLHNKLLPYKFLLRHVRSEEQINHIYEKDPQLFDQIVRYLQHDTRKQLWIESASDGCYIADITNTPQSIEEPSVCDAIDHLFTNDQLQIIVKDDTIIFFVFDTARNFEQGILWTDDKNAEDHTPQSNQTEITQLKKIKNNFYWYQGK